jgi:hypothetical protein
MNLMEVAVTIADARRLDGEPTLRTDVVIVRGGVAGSRWRSSSNEPAGRR